MSLSCISEILVINKSEEPVLFSPDQFFERYNIKHFIIDGGSLVDDDGNRLVGKDKLYRLNSTVKDLFNFININALIKDIIRKHDFISGDKSLLSGLKDCYRLMLKGEYYKAWLFLSDYKKCGDLAYLVFNSDSISITLNEILNYGYHTIESDEGDITFNMFEFYAISGRYAVGGETDYWSDNLSFAGKQLIKDIENQFGIKVFLRLENNADSN